MQHRIARPEDMATLRELMRCAIEELQHGFLSPEQVAASHQVMGIDTQLIRDQTYFLIEDNGVVLGCGGWSYRATLYGGDNSIVAREPAVLDSERDAAKVRAMYTHPDHVRRGIGRRMLSICEEAARQAGFRRVELMATMAGMPLYRASGYVPVESITSRPINGVCVPLMRMHKSLAPCAPTCAAVAGFMQRFEAGKVARQEWTHAAHLVAAHWYLTKLGLEAAIDEMRHRIRFHNESVGTPNTDSAGYHETITRLFVRGVAAVLAKRGADDFEMSLMAVLGSELAASDWPLQYYSRDRLFSIEARATWVAPDLKPAP
jgi:GNAT superfamily N-acetyltransferase